MCIRIAKFLFSFSAVVAVVCALQEDARAGFLYVLNEKTSAPNQIYGFNVNETTGALTPLAGFPISSGGNGAATDFSELLLIDRVNFRLYAVNGGSGQSWRANSSSVQSFSRLGFSNNHSILSSRRYVRVVGLLVERRQ